MERFVPDVLMIQGSSLDKLNLFRQENNLLLPPFQRMFAKIFSERENKTKIQEGKNE